MIKRYLKAVLRAVVSLTILVSLTPGLVSCGESDDPIPEETEETEDTDSDSDSESESESESQTTTTRQITEEELLGRWRGYYEKWVTNVWQIDHYYKSTGGVYDEDALLNDPSNWCTNPVFLKAGSSNLMVWNHSDENIEKIKELIENKETGAVTTYGCDVYIVNGNINWNDSKCVTWILTNTTTLSQLTLLKNKTAVKQLRITQFDGENMSLEQVASNPPKNVSDGYTYYDYYYKLRHL